MATYPRRIVTIAVWAALPAVSIALVLLWVGPYGARVQWTGSLFIAIALLVGLAVLHDHVIRPIQTASNLLAALRERREDIPLLAARFLDRYAAHYRKVLRGFRPEAMTAMLAYAWPGNVRELDHTLERAVLLADQDEIGIADLSLAPGGDRGAHLDQMTLEEVERVLVQKALARSGGHVAEAARALGLSRSALYRRLERFGLS